MATTGMNLAEVEQLVGRLRAGAEQLRNLVSTVEGQVAHTSWIGPDAERFTHEWWPGHRQRLLEAADHISGLAQSADNNASEQARTSSAPGSSGSTTLAAVTAGVVAAVGGAAAGAARPAVPAPAGPATGPVPSASVKSAVDFAQGLKGSGDYELRCLTFVAEAWEAGGNGSLRGYDNPEEFVAKRGGELQQTYPPPAGAAVFWRADQYSSDGHVVLSLGDGTALSTKSADGDNVHVSDIAARNKTKAGSYAGWLALP
jgi:hypothetical protein